MIVSRAGHCGHRPSIAAIKSSRALNGSSSRRAGAASPALAENGVSARSGDSVVFTKDLIEHYFSVEKLKILAYFHHVQRGAPIASKEAAASAICLPRREAGGL